jgi:class 3 adenylate cyclase
MAESLLPSGMVTFLRTDVEGSTRIWEAERSRARVAFERHDALVAEHLASFGGGRPRDQGEGDSAFAVFALARDALGCALALQRLMCAEAWPDGATIRVRMALHTGEAELSSGNYKGSAVHRCARLRGLAHGGQIVVSDRFDRRGSRPARDEGSGPRSRGAPRVVARSSPARMVNRCSTRTGEILGIVTGAGDRVPSEGVVAGRRGRRTLDELSVPRERHGDQRRTP